MRLFQKQRQSMNHLPQVFFFSHIFKLWQSNRINYVNFKSFPSYLTHAPHVACSIQIQRFLLFAHILDTNIFPFYREKKYILSTTDDVRTNTLIYRTKVSYTTNMHTWITCLLPTSIFDLNILKKLPSKFQQLHFK